MRRTQLFLTAATIALAGCTTMASDEAAMTTPSAMANDGAMASSDAQPAMAAPAMPAMAMAPVAPVTDLVRQVDIPYQKFTLANGLRVIVHEDRKAPVVAVSVWYNVGSKDEPKGRTGFAHLFEHLMFNGSENSPGDFFEPLQQIGATDYNGTTNFDRTNYFQTVPTAAVERALFLESDRMGYLLGAVTQEKLDNQRGVVQNEKRQSDNNPGGLAFYSILENIFPEGHPYRHTPIGSMADLDRASLNDVKDWFRDNYGPNNAVLVLAGDISAAQARPLVEKYFGAIKRGAVNTPAAAAIPTLTAPKSAVLKDRVAATQVSRYWPVPGLLDRQLVALDLAGSVLGGLSSSRLDNILVRDEKLAVGVSAGLIPFQRVGLFTVTAVVRPGVDAKLVERRLDEIVAQYIAEGPTAAELNRASTREVSSRIKGLEQVGGFGGKAVALAEGEIYANDADKYKKDLANYASVTPAEVKAVMAQWLTKPAFALSLEPGERGAYQEAAAVVVKPLAKPVVTAATKFARQLPGVGQLTALDFPDVQKATLSNGVRVNYAQRTAVPATQMALSFNAGRAADPADARGLHSLTTGLLLEGTTRLSSKQIAEEKERLGAELSAGGSDDRTTVGLSALSANLAPSLDLLADVVKNPAFADAEVERVRNQVLTGIAQETKDPGGIARRTLPPILYGANHPYAAGGAGDATAVAKLTRADLVRFKDQWLRPDNMEVFVVSDLPLNQVTSLLESRFGNWQAPGVAKGVKSFPAAAVNTGARIVLVDRPNSPQSLIYGAVLTPTKAQDDLTSLESANDILGGNFLSRINMDLRETKGWSYGVRGGVQLKENAVPFVVQAPVQADRTGDSLAALIDNFGRFLGKEGVSAAELTRTVNGSIRELPGQFETSAAVLSAMQSNALYGRPDDYYERLADKYRAQTASGLDTAARGAINPNNMVWIVVGEAAKVRPQLARLGLPIEDRVAQ